MRRWSSRGRPATSRMVSLADSTAARGLRRIFAAMPSAVAMSSSPGTTRLTRWHSFARAADVAGERALSPAADDPAVQRGNDRLAGVVQAPGDAPGEPLVQHAPAE